VLPAVERYVGLHLIPVRLSNRMTIDVEPSPSPWLAGEEGSI